ncbi:MAG: lipoyl synthase, partial [Chloroflexota bacterium]|nr:lipoyl synthase [Chloroflexota bacterium]
MSDPSPVRELIQVGRPPATGVRKPAIRIGQGAAAAGRKPDWLKVRWSQNETFGYVERQLRQHRLRTVCEEAICPNRGECWDRGVATVLIMGDICTRRCGFCAIGKGRPGSLDPREPEGVAETAAILGARYLVITSVDRDDL